MNFKLTLVLVVILAALGITYYFYQKAPSTTADDANAKNLISPKPKAITKITWSRDGSPVYTLEKIAGKDDWQLTAPLTAAVESWSASSIADTLRDLQYKDKFTAEPTGDKSLEETGLDKPKQSVTFTADDKSHTLDLGKRTPAGDIFLRLDNGSLYKADNSFVTTLNKKVSDLRSKDLVKVTSDNVLAIKLIKPDQAISASKTAGKWTIDLPIATRGNATPLDDLVTGVTGLRADNFSSIKKTNPGTGLTPPAISVTLLGKPPITATSSTAPASQPAQASLVTVEFGGQADIAGKQIYASRSDTDEVFLVNADVLKKVDKSLADLRDPAITPVDLTPATQVSITYADPAKLAASMSHSPAASGPSIPLPSTRLLTAWPSANFSTPSRASAPTNMSITPAISKPSASTRRRKKSPSPFPASRGRKPSSSESPKPPTSSPPSSGRGNRPFTSSKTATPPSLPPPSLPCATRSSSTSIATTSKPSPSAPPRSSSRPISGRSAPAPPPNPPTPRRSTPSSQSSPRCRPANGKPPNPPPAHQT